MSKRDFYPMFMAA
jgi:hypothetical protein